jgi:hypothetical protein
VRYCVTMGGKMKSWGCERSRDGSRVSGGRMGGGRIGSGRMGGGTMGSGRMSGGRMRILILMNKTMNYVKNGNMRETGDFRGKYPEKNWHSLQHQ